MLDPHRMLDHVHPDLANVLRGAAQAPIPFQVIYGLRTAAAEAAACASGHSQTMHSRHLGQPRQNGYACAVDVAPLDASGNVYYAKGREALIYGQIARQLQAAADLIHIPVQWGGADVGAWVPGKVSHFHDWGHVQLPWAQYP